MPLLVLLNLPISHQPQRASIRFILKYRWQLDLRTGERLEDQPPPQMSLAMSGQMGNLALAQALGPRPPIFQVDSLFDFFEMS